MIEDITIIEDVMIEMTIVMTDAIEDLALFVEVKAIGKEIAPKDMEEVLKLFPNLF